MEALVRGMEDFVQKALPLPPACLSVRPSFCAAA